MAHFAQVTDDNKVLNVIVVANDDCGGGEFPESEPVGQQFIASLGIPGRWLQTSYHGNFRGTYASVGGWTYDPVADVFVAPPVEETE
jgi:hypothetical protein